MANIVSTQTGDFDDTTTWVGGAVPGAGDTVNIASGHTVTYDTVVSAAFGDVDVDGILVHSAAMEINGLLRIDGGGTLHQKPGSKLSFTGASGDNHGVHFENETDACHIAEGSDGMPTTKLNGALAIGATAIVVDDASKMAAGEWIAMYNLDRTSTEGDYDHSCYADEGVWIHDINSNTIYFRQFVGPDDVTLTATAGSSATSITVSNSKVFRVGDSIIFGTGNSNRNVCRIKAINYNTHVMTLKNLADENDYQVAGSNASGIYVYKTGLEKPKRDNGRVRKIATIATVARAATDTTITLAQDEKFEQDDVIVIECVLQTAGDESIRAWNTHETRHIVQSRSSNVLTLTAAIGYTVPVGALITRITRDIVIEAKNTGATDIVDSTNICHYYGEHTSSNYSRKMILKDVWFKNVGNSNNNVRSGFCTRGYYSTDGTLPVTVANTTEYQPMTTEGWIEGCTTMINGNGRRDYSGMWGYDHRNSCFRACVTVNGQDAFTIHWDPSQRLYNCFGIQNSNRAFRIQGTHYNHEVAYCYHNRNGGRGIYWEPVYNSGRGLHNVKLNVVGNDAMRVNRHTGYSGSLWKIDIKDALYQGPYMSEVGDGDVSCLYSRFRGIEDGDNQFRVSGSSYAGRQGYSTGNATFRLIEADFEYDKVVNYTYYMRYEWDKTQDAYFVQRSFHDDAEEATLKETFFLPANVTARVRVTAKPSSGFSGTEPWAYVGTVSNILGGWSTTPGEAFGDTSTTEWISPATAGGTGQQFASMESNTGWQSIDLTVDPQPFSRYIEAAFKTTDTDTASSNEGFYLRPLQVWLSGMPRHRDMMLNNSTETSRNVVKYGSSHGQVYRRWGGIS